MNYDTSTPVQHAALKLMAFGGRGGLTSEGVLLAAGTLEYTGKVEHEREIFKNLLY